MTGKTILFVLLLFIATNGWWAFATWPEYKNGLLGVIGMFPTVWLIVWGGYELQRKMSMEKHCGR